MFKFLCAALLLLSAHAVSAAALDYTDPIPFGSMIKDKQATLAAGLTRSGWQHQKAEDGRDLGIFEHKGYRIEAELLHSQDSLSIKLLKASCEGCKVDEDDVNSWLTKLRRAIAYEVTVLVRDDAIRQKLAQ